VPVLAGHLDVGDEQVGAPLLDRPERLVGRPALDDVRAAWASTSRISSTAVGSSSTTMMWAPANAVLASDERSPPAIGCSRTSATISGSFTTNAAPFPSPALSA
jgi:hypothetical protein